MEYHLLAYLLAYYAISAPSGSTESQDIIKQNIPEAFTYIPSSLLYAIPFALLVWITTTLDCPALENVAVILAYVATVRSAKALSTASRTPAELYLSPLVLSCILVLLYRREGLRSSLFVVYFLYFMYCLALIANGKASSDSIIDDISLCHLVFYFTK